MVSRLIIGIVNFFQKIFNRQKSGSYYLSQVNVLIVTILDVEFYAVCEVFLGGKGKQITDDIFSCRLGSIPLKNRQKAHLAIVCTKASGASGLTTASTVVSLACQKMPNLELIVVCGIAGGYPYPNDKETHVRLGDILLGTGMPMDMTYGKMGATGLLPSHITDIDAPDSQCCQIATRLRQASELHGESQPPWEKLRANAATNLKNRGVPTPLRNLNWDIPDSKDEFFLIKDAEGEEVSHPHPPDEWRDKFPGQPRVLCGAIDSGNHVGKDAYERDKRRDQFNRKPIGYEMEGYAVAKAARVHGIRYFQVRSVVDYQDKLKTDEWHPTAALRAAAIARCILEERRIGGRAVPGKILQISDDTQDPKSSGIGYKYNLENITPETFASQSTISGGKIEESIILLQKQLDKKDHSEALSIVSQLESASKNRGLPQHLRMRAAMAAAHALVVYQEREKKEGKPFIFQERIRELLSMVEQEGRS